MEENRSRNRTIAFVLMFIVATLIFVTPMSGAFVANQNACDGVLRSYGRCETGTGTITLPQSGINTIALTFPTPFTNTPFVTLDAETPGGAGEVPSESVFYSTNGTRTSGTCKDCSTFTFPAANTLGLVGYPIIQGTISTGGGDGFLTGTPQVPNYVMLTVNVISISNATANGRRLWVQALDPFTDGVDCNNQIWENLGLTTIRGVEPAIITNFGAGYHTGDTNIQGTGEGGVYQLNQTLWLDLLAAGPTGGINCSDGILHMRLVGQLTSGHETITYATIKVTFWYPLSTVQTFVVQSSTTPTSFTVTTLGGPTILNGAFQTVILFTWKAYSESG